MPQQSGPRRCPIAPPSRLFGPGTIVRPCSTPRATDHLARLGRTTFGAILTETDEIRAINYVERIRSACDVWLEAGAVMLRLSIGWSEMSPDRPVEVALPDAERRLYVERQRTWAMLSRETEEREPNEHSESQLIRDLERLRGSGGAPTGPDAGI